MVAFPFARGYWYPFEEFVRFEDHLLAARRLDEKLAADLRTNREPWIKLRNEELYPVLCFCRHSGLPSSTEFCIGLEGAVADIEIKVAGNPARRLQLTTTGPLWPGGPTNWGEDHMLHMRQLNQVGESSGWGPYRKQPDGSITNREDMICTKERDPACLEGIRQALFGKRHNQHSDCELIVKATTYNEAMSRQTFQEIAKAALNEIPLPGFSNVHIMAAADGYLVSREV